MLRQLKWRIVATMMVVVIVGVLLILLMAYGLTTALVATEVQLAFRQSMLTAVSVAAIGAIIAGIIASLLLARQILRPLNQIATSSQRIADGRYDERVPIPSSDELALVATNFNQMAERLAEVEQTRITLIGNVSHELRTPLTSMIGYLEGLMDGLFPGNEETYALMHTEMDRMRRLVNDLQILSRVESGQIQLDPQLFDLRPVVSRIVLQLKPTAEVDNILLQEVKMDTAVPVFADVDRTAQILVNLIGNAIQYTPQGGTITLFIAVETRFARINIQDNGQGIPSEKIPLLFERFYRIDNSRARRSGGSGIGLTISRYLVWAMGGEIWAESKGEGMGSLFSFTLPLGNSVQ